MNLLLNDKVGIVTGASGGIGTAIAQVLAGEGCNLALTGRDDDRLRASAANADLSEDRCLVHAADLVTEGEPERLVDAAVARFGRLDFVVTNAGSAPIGSPLALSRADWKGAFALKFLAHADLIKAAWPHLKASGGTVAIVAGAAGRTPGANGAATGAVNAALLNLTKSLAELGVDDGVRVNAVNPGMTRTARLTRRIESVISREGVDADQAEAMMVRSSRILRVGEPVEIARMIALLVSPAIGFLHGSIIDVDGGKTKTL